MSSNPDRIADSEPLTVAEIARLVVALLVSLGIVEANDPVLGTIIGVVGGVISLALTLWGRRKVTPLAAPRDHVKRPLVPTAPPKPPPKG